MLMLSTPWEQRKTSYDIVVIGSGYGGAITAARLATADLNPKRSICVLERGKEWQPGEYPEAPLDVAGATRSDVNPLGLYDLDRKIRPVGVQYRRLISQWSEVLPAERICLHPEPPARDIF